MVPSAVCMITLPTLLVYDCMYNVEIIVKMLNDQLKSIMPEMVVSAAVKGAEKEIMRHSSIYAE